MDSLKLSNKNCRESDGPSEEDRDVSPTRKSNKTKQKRKTSTVSLRDNGKTKSRASKGRQSMVQTTQEMADALKLAKPFNIKSNGDGHLPTFDESHAENDDDNKEEAADQLSKLTFEEDAAANLLQQSEGQSAMKNRYSIGEFNIPPIEKPTWLQEPEPKNVMLEDRLENDNEFDVTGILNLSCMNVTDSDLPAVVQRAFWGGPKKCTGLILRDNALTADGVRVIVDTILAGRASLKYLSFSSNPDIGDAGIEHIVRLLQKSRSMSFLALPRTGMTDRGVRLLADVLCGVDSEATAPPPPLEKLYISFNKLITDESLEPLLQILEQNQKLKVLSLEHCGLSDKAHRRLRQAATKLKKKKFSLSG